MGATTLGRANRAGPLQGQAGHPIAQLVAVALNQRLVKVLHREATAHLLMERPRPRQLTLRRATRRRLADPTVRQSLLALIA